MRAILEALHSLQGAPGMISVLWIGFWQSFASNPYLVNDVERGSSGGVVWWVQASQVEFRLETNPELLWKLWSDFTMLQTVL